MQSALDNHKWPEPTGPPVPSDVAAAVARKSTEARTTHVDAASQQEPEAIEPLMLRVNEAAKALRISEWLLYTQYIHTNRLPVVKAGRRTLVPVAALKALAGQLQAEGSL